jgi:hypothetical protein
MFDSMAVQRRGILKDGMMIARTSDGSIQYPQVLLLSPYERSLAREIVEEVAEAIRNEQGA